LVVYLERSTEELMAEAPSVRVLLSDVVDGLPEDLAERLNAAAFLDSHRLRVSKARDRLAARKENIRAVDALELQKAEALKHKAVVDALSAEPVTLDAEAASLHQEISDLEATLATKREKLSLVEQRCGALPTLISQEEAALKSAIYLTAQMKKSIKEVRGSTEADMAIIDEVDSIRLGALESLRRYLG
jgi:predicted  nucleic acid-binding Zn-ribbon protein